MILQKFKSYILLKKDTKDGEKPNFNLRMMHGINKISILLFLVGILFLILKTVLK